MAAKESRLSTLHELLAENYIRLVEHGRPIYDLDPETGENKIVGYMPLTAAELQAVNKFLKDNDITCAPDDNNAIGELQERLRERNSRRQERQLKRQREQEGLSGEHSEFFAGLNATAMQ